ncbi:hypothetical protein L1987_58326 [Smallanthus sonchifolius]|uniref:Uncharacterized protein n=1 Tax=Smallanthus sonchifolius TaxID=185202 RepID=A0ACB9DFT6_9ASTR|nr:hypothetical protein L1987_58326 [Smallanthus sonchifolius]
MDYFPYGMELLVHLRWNTFLLPSIEKPMNLQTISHVAWGDGIHNVLTCFPYIKELTCRTDFNNEIDFKSLTYLEKLNLIVCGKNHITFPATLKTLALYGCRLPWSDMSIIQTLPNLLVLKLRHSAFEGSCWNTND